MHLEVSWNRVFLWKRVRCIDESRNINLLAAPCILITTHCPLKVLGSASVHLEVSWRQVFLWKGVRCIERIWQYTSVARLLRPYYNRLPSESVTKCVCAPRNVLESSFSLKRVRCIERTWQYTSLGCFLRLYDNRLASETWPVHLEVSWNRLFLWKTSLQYWKNLAIYICRLLPASLLQPIAVESLARVHLCASKCLGIDFFSEIESAVSIESRNIRMLSASCVLITSDCALNVWLLSSGWGKNCPDTLPSH